MSIISGATATFAERAGARILVCGGLLLVAIGLGLMMMADVHSSWTVLIPDQMFTAVGGGILNPALAALVLQTAPADRAALATGINDSARQAGIAVGVAALGILIPMPAAAEADFGPRFVDGLRHALLAATVLAGLGAIGSTWLLGRGVADGGEPATVEEALAA